MAKKFHKISILAKIFEILPELGYHSDRVETSSTTFLCRNPCDLCSFFTLGVWVFSLTRSRRIVTHSHIKRLDHKLYEKQKNFQKKTDFDVQKNSRS